MDLVGNVENSDVVIVDDMIDTAGTLGKAADTLAEKGGQFDIRGWAMVHEGMGCLLAWG